MGEGDPGRMITMEFYDEARRLTKARGTFLVSVFYSLCGLFD